MQTNLEKNVTLTLNKLEPSFLDERIDSPLTLLCVILWLQITNKPSAHIEAANRRERTYQVNQSTLLYASPSSLPPLFNSIMSSLPKFKNKIDRITINAI